MRFAAWLILLTWPLPAEVVSFDNAAPGALPAGWTQSMTHAGGDPKWEVLADPTAPSPPNVLAQTSTDRTGGRFPLAVYDKASLRNGEVSVRFKPISGAVDQAGGLVWRYRDQDNYYLVRANALENNVVLYKVEGGKRSSIAPQGAAPKTYGVKHPVASGRWHELRVVFRNAFAEVYFNGTRLFKVKDATFRAPGKIGLWTKADSVTHFDDFRFMER
jgi:hypothetical protein